MSKRTYAVRLMVEGPSSYSDENKTSSISYYSTPHMWQNLLTHAALFPDRDSAAYHRQLALDEFKKDDQIRKLQNKQWKYIVDIVAVTSEYVVTPVYTPNHSEE